MRVLPVVGSKEGVSSVSRVGTLVPSHRHDSLFFLHAQAL